MDDSQRTGYLAGVRLPALPRAVLVATLVGSLLLIGAGFFVGRALGTERTPAAAPLTAAPAPAAGNPIVIPEPLEIPDA